LADRFIKLAKENLEETKTGISIDSLRKPFCEAVAVAVAIAKWFKIPYIWIDSLCVIQNRKGDWNTEARLMCEVYQMRLAASQLQVLWIAPEDCSLRGIHISSSHVSLVGEVSFDSNDRQADVEKLD
jgi:hypothetical protein